MGEISGRATDKHEIGGACREQRQVTKYRETEIQAFILVMNSLLSGKPCELTSSVSKLFKSRPGHAIPVITIDSPPSCSLVHRVHYTELDVTQIRARVRPHTALLLSYLCRAPLRGGSIAEVWSFISSV